MKTEEITKGNKLLAKFMGFTVLEFHKSYDWLIPVCGKISQICEEPEELDELRMALLCADIDTAWKECVDWITNYNKLNETDKV